MLWEDEPQASVSTAFFRASLCKHLNHILKAKSRGVCLKFWIVASLPFMPANFYFKRFFSPGVIFVLSLHVDCQSPWYSLIASTVRFNLIWGSHTMSTD